MKAKFRLSIMVIILLPVLWINASGAMKVEVGGTGKICGSIRNAASNQPLGYVAVTLFSKTDSSMVAGTISDIHGKFVISLLTTGDYFLEISEPGFEKKYIAGLTIQAINPRVDTGEVLLNPDAEKRKRANPK